MALCSSHQLFGTNEPHDTNRVPLTDVKKVRPGRVSYEFLQVMEERQKNGFPY